MAYKANILLGQITKVHGFKGAVTVKLEKNFTENIPEMESVFLGIEGKPVPFFISSLEYPGGDILWLKFEGYDSIQNVREFTGSRVFLSSDASEENPQEDLSILKGYRIHSADNREIGTVIELIENTGQVLLNIDTGRGKEILIPFHENLIIKADRKKKIIKMDLPEGLTDLN
jgi:16S rRNA processing protein RimM